MTSIINADGIEIDVDVLNFLAICCNACMHALVNGVDSLGFKGHKTLLLK